MLIIVVTTPSPSISKVAFSAILTTPLALGEHQIVEYDKVLTNIGNGYDSRHGHFTAPIKAVYLFSCSMMNIEGKDRDDAVSEWRTQTMSPFSSMTITTWVAML
jgi:hypothetical protein